MSPLRCWKGASVCRRTKVVSGSDGNVRRHTPPNGPCRSFRQATLILFEGLCGNTLGLLRCTYRVKKCMSALHHHDGMRPVSVEVQRWDPSSSVTSARDCCRHGKRIATGGPLYVSSPFSFMQVFLLGDVRVSHKPSLVLLLCILSAIVHLIC